MMISVEEEEEEEDTTAVTTTVCPANLEPGWPADLSDN